MIYIDNKTSLLKNDKSLRRMIVEQGNRPCSYEKLLLAFCISNQSDIPSIANFPYIMEYEYLIEPERPDKGKGDLLLSDGNNNLLVVEAKYLPYGNKTDSSKRCKARRIVKEQAQRYKALVQQKYPNSKVDSITLTNDLFKKTPGLEERFNAFMVKKKKLWDKRKLALYSVEFATENIV